MDVPADVRESAEWLLRHYPEYATVRSVGMAEMPDGFENPFGVHEEYEKSQNW